MPIAAPAPSPPACSPAPVPTATELVHMVRGAAGSEAAAAAWGTLVGRYAPVVHRAVRAFHLSEADAADVVQSTWLCAMERISTLRDPECFGAWLKTIAHRECLHTYHRLRREVPADVAVMEVAAAAPGPEAVALRRDACRTLRRAVGRLPERGRRLVDGLFSQPELDYAEVARSIPMPIGSIGPTRQRALRTLRGQLEEAGYGPGDGS